MTYEERMQLKSLLEKASYLLPGAEQIIVDDDGKLWGYSFGIETGRVFTHNEGEPIPTCNDGMLVY